ncbi:MAG: hypothetical protein ACOX5A_11880 [Aminivibrio sp.]
MRIRGEVIREPRTRSEVLLWIEGARLLTYGDSVTFPGYYPVPVTPKGRELLEAFFDEARKYAETLD